MTFLKNFRNTKKAFHVYAPISGTVKALEFLSDGVFSEHLLGEGAVIIPDSETIVSPFDGEVIMTVESRHAIGLRSTDGVEVLIHVGIDTVMMNGESFHQTAVKGQTVKQGEPLLSFSKKAIADAGYQDSVVIIVSNSPDFKEIHPANEGEINSNDLLITIK